RRSLRRCGVHPRLKTGSCESLPHHSIMTHQLPDEPPPPKSPPPPDQPPPPLSPPDQPPPQPPEFPGTMTGPPRRRRPSTACGALLMDCTTANSTNSTTQIQNTMRTAD